MELVAIISAVVALGALGALVLALRRGGRGAGEADAAAREADAAAREEMLRELSVLRQQVTTLETSHGQTSSALQEALTSRTSELNQAVMNQTNALNEAVGTQTTALQHAIRQLSSEHGGKSGQILGQLEQVVQAQQLISQETNALSQAMRKPGVRGKWGEMTLRNVITSAGLAEHVDFDIQSHLKGGLDEADARPDLVVKLPDGGSIPVDAKMPLDAFQDAIAAESEADREAHLDRHVQSVRGKVQELASKAYWSRFKRAPEMVVMFIGSEAAFSAAVGRAPDLLEYAIEHKVAIATPATLLATLQAVQMIWREQAMSENAEKVRALAVQLAERIGKLSEHLGSVGKGLQGAVKSYNEAVNSYDSRLVVTARKLGDLGVGEAESLEAPPEVELAPTNVVELETSPDSAEADDLGGTAQVG